MNLSIGMLAVLTVVVLAVFLADIRRVIADRFAYRIVWAAALAIVLGCGYMIG
jgi:ribose/xylose/arabinose/galactoside ABC-type transport system permease subunit